MNIRSIRACCWRCWNINPAGSTAHNLTSYKTYPMGRFETNREGFYRQLAWTADTLNKAFYRYKIDALAYVILTDSSLVMLSNVINPGLLFLRMAQLTDQAGYPPSHIRDRLSCNLPQFLRHFLDRQQTLQLTQPTLILPFENGAAWSFTGGPHGGWGNGPLCLGGS